MNLSDYFKKWPRIAKLLGTPKKRAVFRGDRFSSVGGLVVPVKDLIREEFSSDRLRLGAPFLRLDKVQVGDVLLTRGRHLDSRVIAWLGGGTYSHASVFVGLPPISSDPTRSLIPQLIESEDLGTGYTDLDDLWLRIGAGKQERVGSIPGHPLAAILLRHEALSTVGNERLLKASEKIEEQLWLEYPPWERLVGAIRANRLLDKKFLRAALQKFDRPVDPIADGSFCSQLVAQFFEELQIDLLKEQVTPSDISPNLLIGESSNLVEVDDAIIYGSAITDNSVGERIWSPTLPVLDVSRETWLPQIKEWKYISRKLREVLPPVMQSLVETYKRRADKRYIEASETYSQQGPRLAKIIRQLHVMEETSDELFSKQRDSLLYLMAISHIVDRATEKIDSHPLARRARGVLIDMLELKMGQLWYELMSVEAGASRAGDAPQPANKKKTDDRLPQLFEMLKSAEDTVNNWTEDADVVPFVESLLTETKAEFGLLKEKMREREAALAPNRPPLSQVGESAV